MLHVLYPRSGVRRIIPMSETTTATCFIWRSLGTFSSEIITARPRLTPFLSERVSPEKTFKQSVKRWFAIFWQIKGDWKYSRIMSWFNTRKKIPNQTPNKCKAANAFWLGNLISSKRLHRYCLRLVRTVATWRNVCSCKKMKNYSGYFIRTMAQQTQISESHSCPTLGINFTHRYSRFALAVGRNATACQCGVIN